jgi:hypothetical protein
LNERIVRGPSTAPRQAWLAQDDGLFEKRLSLRGTLRLTAILIY